MGIANIITLFRLLLVPVFISTFHFSFWSRYYLAPYLFGLAASSDLLDGYLARRLNQISTLGTFLDPLADKLLVISTLTLMVYEGKLPWLGFPTLLILFREIIISLLRTWTAYIGKSTYISVSELGKLKTILQMLSITLLLFYRPDQPSRIFFFLAYGLFYCSVFLTLISLQNYLYSLWNHLAHN